MTTPILRPSTPSTALTPSAVPLLGGAGVGNRRLLPPAFACPLRPPRPSHPLPRGFSFWESVT